MSLLSDISRNIRYLRHGRIAQYLSLASSVICLGTSIYIGATGQYREVTKVLIPLGIGTSASAVFTAKSSREMEEYLRDIQDISAQQTTNNLYQQMEYQLPPAKLRYFNWSLLDSMKDDYPHIIIVGKSGSGKSTMAEFLADKLSGESVAVAPHYKVGDFPTVTKIVGQGRNIKASTEYLYLLEQEMTKRYQLPDKKWEGLNVICDEYPLYAKEVKEPVGRILREGRKVGIRLVIITQDDDPVSLGVDGNSGILDNLTYVRLKEKAEEYVIRLWRQDRVGYQQLYDQLGILDVMVDKEPASLPNISH